MGCRFVPITLAAKSLSPLGEARTLAQLLATVRRERPAAMLTWTIKANLWGGLAGRITGVPVVANVSGLGVAHDGSRGLARIADALYRLALSPAKTVFFQNPTDRDTLVGRGAVRADQARVLTGSGVDLARFRPTGPLVRPTQRRVLMCARLLGAKGVREYVAAAELLRPVFPEVEFALLGFTDVAAADAITRAEVDVWDARGGITYHEPVEDTRPSLESSEAVVLPSYYREGLSRALLEAAAMGRPVVTTDHPGCREAIVDGVTGFLCAPRDVYSLAEAMRRMLELPDAEWEAMARAARERAESEFSEERIVEEYRAALAREGVAAG